MPIRKIPERIIEVPYSDFLLTEYDIWKLRKTWDMTATGQYIRFTNAGQPSNDLYLVRESIDGFTKIGTGMSLDDNTGTFSFPSTGYYEIIGEFSMISTGGASTYCAGFIQTTTTGTFDGDNNIKSKLDSSHSTNAYSSTSFTYTFKVDNITNCKVKFGGLVATNTQFEGDRTKFIFKKIGEI